MKNATTHWEIWAIWVGRWQHQQHDETTRIYANNSKRTQVISVKQSLQIVPGVKQRLSWKLVEIHGSSSQSTRNSVCVQVQYFCSSWIFRRETFLVSAGDFQRGRNLFLFRCSFRKSQKKQPDLEASKIEGVDAWRCCTLYMKKRKGSLSGGEVFG